MTPEQTVHMLLSAAHFGGSFMRTIARAGLVADPANRQRLVDAFPELCATYGPHTALYREDWD